MPRLARVSPAHRPRAARPIRRRQLRCADGTQVSRPNHEPLTTAGYRRMWIWPVRHRAAYLPPVTLACRLPTRRTVYSLFVAEVERLALLGLASLSPPPLLVRVYNVTKGSVLTYRCSYTQAINPAGTPQSVGSAVDTATSRASFIDLAPFRQLDPNVTSAVRLSEACRQGSIGARRVGKGAWEPGAPLARVAPQSSGPNKTLIIGAAAGGGAGLLLVRRGKAPHELPPSARAVASTADDPPADDSLSQAQLTTLLPPPARQVAAVVAVVVVRRRRAQVSSAACQAVTVQVQPYQSATRDGDRLESAPLFSVECTPLCKGALQRYPSPRCGPVPLVKRGAATRPTALHVGLHRMWAFIAAARVSSVTCFVSGCSCLGQVGSPTCRALCGCVVPWEALHRG